MIVSPSLDVKSSSRLVAPPSDTASNGRRRDRHHGKGHPVRARALPKESQKCEIIVSDLLRNGQEDEIEAG